MRSSLNYQWYLFKVRRLPGDGPMLAVEKINFWLLCSFV